MKAVVAAFNQEKALVGAFSVITNLRMELFQALLGSVQLSPASSRSCSGAPRSPRCWPPPGCCSPSCRRTWALPCALRPPAALQPQLILAARINTAERLLLHSFFCCFEKLSSAGKSMNFPDRLKRCTGAISADVCTADIFGPIIGSIRPEILERFYIT